MYLKQLIDEYDFDDMKYFFENDKYFTYLSGKYNFSDEDEENFNKLKYNDLDYNKYSLDVLTLKKDRFLYRIYLRDKDDELEMIKNKDLEELSTYGVDVEYTQYDRKSYLLIIGILLENSYYMNEEYKKSSKIEESNGYMEIEKAEVEEE